MDSIIIKGLKLFAYHGVNAQEKQNGQDFLIDAELFADLSLPCQNDKLEGTINYSAAVKRITASFKEHKFDLIERAAEYVADAVLREFPATKKIILTVKKPDAPISAEFDFVAVKITRGEGI